MNGSETERRFAAYSVAAVRFIVPWDATCDGNGNGGARV